MSSKIFNLKVITFSLLVFLIIFTRFIKLDWGNSFFFNPDENNMASSIFQMTSSNLNPNFFAYGQFPLYLTFFTTPKHDFQNIILTLRFWSATFSCLSILFLYLISKNIFKDIFSRLAFIILLIFNPGLIQLSHFGTTESILIFVFILNIYLSQKFLKNRKIIYIILAAVVSGIGLASKISALILTVPIFLTLLFTLIKNKKIINFLLNTVIFVALTLFVITLFSPFNFLNSGEFISSMNYEISVATGNIKVFYTNQFLNSLPYIFQIKNIFPYTNGIFVFIFSGLGLIYFIKNKNYKELKWLLILIPCLIYFLYNGQLYTKWTRFMSPIFFLFPLLTVYFINQFKTKFIKYLLVFISIIPGVVFLNLYFQPDIRLTASNWINKNISQDSKILSESGNVINIPLKNNNLQVNNFDFYKSENINNLSTEINNSNYIFVPSRRVFKNNFPETKKYYQDLFSGSLGFSKIQEFKTNIDFLLNSENAEETWSVFDHPTIRIFKKNV
ncbi:MAG: glycosyltransferase family 39 protein [Candidatus Shapirobacteria bacterium]